HLLRIEQKKKGTARDDRATDRSAILVSLEVCLVGGEKIPGVEFVVAEKLKQRAVELVSARAGGELDARAGARLAGAEIRCLDRELLHGVRAGQYRRGAEMDVGVVQAVQLERIVGATIAIHGDLVVRALEIDRASVLAAGVD